jgi:hypothetical protein
MILKAKDFSKHFESILEKTTSFKPSFTKDGWFLELRAESVGSAENMSRLTYTQDRSEMIMVGGASQKIVGPPWVMRTGRTYEIMSDIQIVGLEGWPEGVVGMAHPHPTLAHPPFFVLSGLRPWTEPGLFTYRVHVAQEMRLDFRVPICVLALFSMGVEVKSEKKIKTPKEEPSA